MTLIHKDNIWKPMQPKHIPIPRRKPTKESVIDSQLLFQTHRTCSTYETKCVRRNRYSWRPHRPLWKHRFHDRYADTTHMKKHKRISVDNGSAKKKYCEKINECARVAKSAYFGIQSTSDRTMDSNVMEHMRVFLTDSWLSRTHVWSDVSTMSLLYRNFLMGMS